MITQEPHEVAQKAERIYEDSLKETLERTHPGQFVAIEPASGDYFLGLTLSEAIAAARKAHAERLPHVLRVGHRSTIHIGVCES